MTQEWLELNTCFVIMFEIGRMAKWSKALVWHTLLIWGVGLNPNIKFYFPILEQCGILYTSQNILIVFFTPLKNHHNLKKKKLKKKKKILKK